MKTKTADLTGPALDWAVAQCESIKVRAWWAPRPNAYFVYFVVLEDAYKGSGPDTCYSDPDDTYYPSANWSQGGPIIERDHMTVTYNGNDDAWEAYSSHTGMSDDYERGRTPMIAAMRYLVASKLGDTVEIPDDLMETL